MKPNDDLAVKEGKTTPTIKLNKELLDINKVERGILMPMKMADFKALSLEERLTKLNNHLLKLKDVPGRLEENLKSGEFDFSYSLLKKAEKELGITVDGKAYCAYAQIDIFNLENAATEQDVVMLEQNNVKQQQDTVKQASQEIVKSQQTLTNAEIAFVKELYAKTQLNNEQQFLVNDKPLLVVPVMTGAKKTTGISVYTEQWARWSEFKKKYQMYSGTDLLALALEEFMEKYGDCSDS